MISIMMYQENTSSVISLLYLSDEKNLKEISRQTSAVFVQELTAFINLCSPLSSSSFLHAIVQKCSVQQVKTI
jgi:predicted DNA-binding ArsR family transcriptional regulator